MTLLGAAKVTSGCPKGPELPAGHSATGVAHRQEPWSSGGSEQDREHFTAAFQQSSEGSLAGIWVREGAAAAPARCKPTAGALCYSAPGQEGPWTQGWLLAPLPGEGTMETAWRELLFPIPCPSPGQSHSECPQMTHGEKSDAVSEKRGWNKMVLKLRASQLLLPESPIPAADLDAP